jgi:hypothetical protein
LAAAIAAGEILPPEGRVAGEFSSAEVGTGLSPAVLAAEEVADGRVRVPKLRRRVGDVKGRPHRAEEGDESPPTDFS